MRHYTMAALALAGAGIAGTAQAGGIERTTQSMALLFAEGNRVELSYGSVSPDLSGTSRFVPAPTGDVARDYGLPSLGLRMEVNDRLALALIYDRPFGADISYDPANPILGGTRAEAETDTLTALALYRFNENVSVFGGARYQRASGSVTLSGAAYGPLNGYNVTLGEDDGWGWVLGAAYEIPDIALRVALHYQSEVAHDFATRESIAPGVVSNTRTKTPASWNLEFQTGIAPQTLLMGSVRYVEHSAFQVNPATFTALNGGEGLVDLEDSVTYRLGVGRQFTDRLSGSVMFGYEAPRDRLVSPLAPSTGFRSVSLGLAYQATDAMEISGGVTYVDVGSASPETGTPDVARADFSGNEAVGFGLKVAYRF